MQIKNQNNKLRRSLTAVAISSCLLLSGCYDSSGGNGNTDASANTLPTVPVLDISQGRERVPFNATISATDADGDSLIYTKLSGPDWLSISNAGAVTGTPNVGSNGSEEITFRVFDGTDKVEGSATVTVGIENHTPTGLAVDNLAGLTGQAYQAAVSAQDEDGDTITIAIVTAPEWLTLENDTLAGTPPAAGNYNITLSVSDDEFSPEETFVLVVEDPNSAPTDLALDNLAAIATGNYAGTLSAQDIDADPLTYTIVGEDHGWLSITGDQLTGSPSVDGNFAVTISVSDGEDSIEETFTIVVDPVAVAFSSSVIIKNGGVEGDEYSVSAATLADSATGPNPDDLVYSITAGPTWLSVDADTGALSGTFTAAEENTFTVMIEDSGETDEATLKITHALFGADVLPNAIAGLVGTSTALDVTDGHDNSNLTITSSDDLGGTDDLFEITDDGNIVMLREPLEAEYATKASGNLTGNLYTLALSATDGIANDTPDNVEQIYIREVFPMGLQLMETVPAEWANLAEYHTDGFGMSGLLSPFDHADDAVGAANGGAITSTKVLRVRRGADIAAIFDTTGQQDITLYYDVGAKDLVGGLEFATSYSIDGINWEPLVTFSNDDDGTGNPIANQVFMKKVVALPADANNQKTLWIQFNNSGTTGAQHGYIDNFLIQGTPIAP